MKEREPNGTINPDKYSTVVNELKSKLEQLPDKNGNKMKTKNYLPYELYSEVKDDYPDLWSFLMI